MKQILNLIIKEYKLFWNDKVGVSLTFLVPLVLIFIFGSVFGGSSEPQGIRLAFVNNSTSPIAVKLEKTLDTMKTFSLIKNFTDEEGKIINFDTINVKDYIRKGNASSALIIPEDAYTDTSLGLKLKFYYDPKNDMEMQLVTGMLQKTIMEQLPSLFNASMMKQSREFLGEEGDLFNREMAVVIGKYFDVDTAEILNPNFDYLIEEDTVQDTSESSANFFNDILKIERTQLVGKDIANPVATRNVGGWAMMFLLFSITASASSLFDEKKNGVVLRLLSSPVSRAQILWGKYLFNFSLGIIQMLLLFMAGKILFNVDVFSNFGNLLIVIICGSAVCTAFGMLLAAFSKTSAQANGWGTFLILSMSAIGGAWFPTFLMPAFIQLLGKFTFIYWTIEGFLKVLWRGDAFIEIIPNIAILLGMTIILNLISLLQFKKGHVF